MYQKRIKRILDFAVTLCGFVVMAPAFFALMLAVKLDSEGPVFFRQKRVGIHKTYFEIIKFRTMRTDAPGDMPTHMLADPERYITEIGAFLRKTSLDELPQMINILKGEMSLVGPRPALWNQEDLIRERDKYGANDCLPGLTGWAQVNGRDELEIEDKARLDGVYVRHMGFRMDCICLWRTIASVLKREGVVEGRTGMIAKQVHKICDREGDFSEVSIGVVTYNSSEDIEGLLNSLQKSSHKNMAVYVVDNASTDNTVEKLEKSSQTLMLIKSARNLGFGKAHNKMIGLSNSKYHIICNPDIRVGHDTIQKCVDYMNLHDDIAVLTPLVRNIDGTQQFLPKKNPAIKYMLGGLFESYIPFCKHLRDEYTLRNKKIVKPVDVEFCTGCFMVVRTEALKQVGGFDERYFLHFEDADLTRKLKKIGRAVYNPDIEITHVWHRDNKKMNKSFWIAFGSMIKYMSKWNSMKKLERR